MKLEVYNATHVSVCGDSFGVGSGMPMHRCFEDSFGGQVSSTMGIPLKVYARSGSCNFLIYLQVKKVVEQSITRNDRPLVLINLTSYSRIVFPYDSRSVGGLSDLSNVDYRSYHPYHKTSHPRRELEFDTVESPNLTSETISNVGLALHGNMESPGRLAEVAKKKWKAISIYFEEIYDDSVKIEIDSALATTMHYMLEKAGLPHIFIGVRKDFFPMIPNKNFLEENWGDISKLHQDPAMTKHCNAVGHGIVASKILEKIAFKNKD